MPSDLIYGRRPVAVGNEEDWSENVVLSMADLMGWVGGLMAAAAYVLVARGRLAPDSARFHGVNVAAAALLAVAAFDHDAIPSGVLNLLWIAFGGMSVVAGARARTVTSTPRSEGAPSAREMRAAA